MAATEETLSTPADRGALGNSWIPYVVPMAAFFIFTMFEPHGREQYPYFYILKIALVTVFLIMFRKPLTDIRFEARLLVPAVLVGAAVFGEWIWLQPLTHYPHFAFLGKRVEYNPFVSIDNSLLRACFLVARFYGLVVLVPIVEEIFWRSFLLRFLTDPDDFKRLRIGEFSWVAFSAVALAFGMAHPEWLEAVLCAVAYGLLLRQTKSLFACVVAHGVTNLMLGIYVVTQHAWKFW